MALPRVYYYNKGRARVAVKGADINIYWLAPRGFTYLTVALKSNFVLPKEVVTYNVPGWFQDYHWPAVRPWESQPDDDEILP